MKSTVILVSLVGAVTAAVSEVTKDGNGKKTIAKR